MTSMKSRAGRHGFVALLVLGCAFVALVAAGCGGGTAQQTASASPPPPAPQGSAPQTATPQPTSKDPLTPATTEPATGSEPTGAPSQTSAGELASGWRYRFDMTSPANDNFGVTTRELYMYFKPDTGAVAMRIENRLGVAVKILWDEMTFTDADGRMSKAVHRGVTYNPRLNPQEPTWIQANQVYSDIVFPVHLLDDPSAASGTGIRPLLWSDLRAQSYVGKSFGFKLVVAGENDERLEYDVRFRIASTYPVR
jgi:hypothetical protein